MLGPIGDFCPHGLTITCTNSLFGRVDNAAESSVRCLFRPVRCSFQRTEEINHKPCKKNPIGMCARGSIDSFVGPIALFHPHRLWTRGTARVVLSQRHVDRETCILTTWQNAMICLGKLMLGKKKVSVVTSAYNEVDCVDELARRLSAVFETMPDYEFEVLVVENGSTDGTYERLEEIRKTDPRFKIIQLARNFHMDGGITAGLAFADGDAVVLMAADLQDPPELIPEFVARWEEGYENIFGVVTARRGTHWLRRTNSRLFYWTIGRLTGQLIPPNASDFRLLDRRVYEQVRRMEERNRFVRGLVAWVGFRSIGIEFERPERFAGESKAYPLRVVPFAVRAVFSHSLVPLTVIPIVGIGLFIASLLALVGLAIEWTLNGVPFPGFGTIIAVMVMLFGILCCFLSIVSIYVGLIYQEVKARPNFVVRQVRGLDGSYPPEPTRAKDSNGRQSANSEFRTFDDGTSSHPRSLTQGTMPPADI